MKKLWKRFKIKELKLLQENYWRKNQKIEYFYINNSPN